jgi:hypothetical protein
MVHYPSFVSLPISSASSFAGRSGIHFQKSFPLAPQLKLRQPARAQLIAGLDPGTQTPGEIEWVGFRAWSAANLCGIFYSTPDHSSDSEDCILACQVCGCEYLPAVNIVPHLRPSGAGLDAFYFTGVFVIAISALLLQYQSYGGR